MYYQNIVAQPIYPNQTVLHISLEIPKACPICDTGNIDDPINAYHLSGGEFGFFDICAEYFCPKCKKMYLAYYTCHTSDKKANCPIRGYSFAVKELPHIPDSVSRVSAKFSDIYSQALDTESKNLNELTGIGLRKALEYLIKDYSIYKHPEKNNEIRKATLSNCIKNYIDSPRIKQLAVACTWLGNDETHYERKHEDRDIGDMKSFLKALIAFIDYDILADEADKFISSSHVN